MMPGIRTGVVAVSVLAAFGGIAHAEVDAQCLKHLGGGYSDTECYAGLRSKIVEENKGLYKRIRATMPSGSEYAKLLDKYMKAQDDATSFCTLQRDAYDWAQSPDGTMYRAMYEQCVFNLRKEQNKFLKELLAKASE
jgi:hypothetical protein